MPRLPVAALALLGVVVVWFMPWWLGGGARANGRVAVQGTGFADAQWAEARALWVAREVRAQRWPTLFPHRGLGEPIGTEAWTATVHPLRLLILLGDGEPLAFELTYLARVLIAAFGAWWLARRRGIPPAGAVLCGACYGLAGPGAALMHSGFADGAALLPWTIAAATAWLRAPTVHLLAATAMLFAFTAIGGGAALAAVGLVAIGMEHRRGFAGAGALWWTLGATMLATAWFWLPGLERAHGSPVEPTGALVGLSPAAWPPVLALVPVVLAVREAVIKASLATGLFAASVYAGAPALATAGWLWLAVLAGRGVTRGVGCPSPAVVGSVGAVLTIVTLIAGSWTAGGVAFFRGTLATVATMLASPIAIAALVVLEITLPVSRPKPAEVTDLRLQGPRFASKAGGVRFVARDSRPTPWQCVDHDLWDRGQVLDDERSRAFDRLREDDSAHFEWRRTVGAEYELGDLGRLLRVADPALAWFPAKIEGAADFAGATGRLDAAGLAPSDHAVVEGAADARGPPSGSANLYAVEPDGLVVRAQTSRRAWLVIAAPWRRELTIERDGESLPSAPANLALTAVELPLGRHELRLRYPFDPTGLAFWTSLLGAITLAITLLRAAQNPRFSFAGD